MQQAILAALRGALAPEGIGYISYNVYPGWKAKEIVRDAMLLRGGAATTPQEKVSYARGMIDFLEEVAPVDSVLAKALGDYKAQGHMKDADLLHEELATFNSPCYLLEMESRSRANGLMYLAEATPHTMFATNYGDKVAEPLLKECGHSQVLLEQYLDFVVNRTFRQSLLVHAERAPHIRYTLDRARYQRLHFAAWLPPVDERTRLDDSTQEFGRAGQVLTTAVPDIKAAMEALTARWPWTLSRQDLLDAVRARLSSAGIEAAANQEPVIDELLEYLIVHGLASYRLDPVLLPPTSTPRPDESARRLAELVRDDAEPCIYNAWHESVSLSATDRLLLPLLDGTRDRDSLIEALLAATRAGRSSLRARRRAVDHRGRDSRCGRRTRRHVGRAPHRDEVVAGSRSTTLAFSLTRVGSKYRRRRAPVSSRSGQDFTAISKCVLAVTPDLAVAMKYLVVGSYGMSAQR